MGFAYGKVDHDRIALLVALAVLPTAPWVLLLGRRRARTPIQDTRAGWALRAVQVTVVLTYVLSFVVKMRVSGPGWITSAILVSAITRRGTMFADPLLNYPWFLRVSQGLICAFEVGSPLMLLRNRLGRAYVTVAFAFHLVTYSMITISFRPHLVCLAAFLPLERVLRLRPAQPVDGAEYAHALDDIAE
jgi:hypothetical protein